MPGCGARARAARARAQPWERRQGALRVEAHGGRLSYTLRLNRPGDHRVKWQRGHRSSNVEDRRGRPAGGLKLGVTGTVIGVVVLLVFGQDFLGITTSSPTGSGGSDADPELVEFVSFVLDDAQEVWTRVFAEQGMRYEEAKMVLFTDRVDSEGCGLQSSATGPFYCPPAHKVFIDLGFYQALRDRLGAPGDFAQAYVIAHEIGHHVQNLVGTGERVDRETAANPGRENDLSVRQELQADCFAGIWAHSAAARDLLEQGDIEEALNAASSIGDDRLQSQGGGEVTPETWTHGSSAQRVRWFRRGYEQGSMQACDTFSVSQP